MKHPDHDERAHACGNALGLIPPGHLCTALRDATEEELAVCERILHRARTGWRISQDSASVVGQLLRAQIG